MAGLVRLTHRSNLELFAEDLTRKAGSGPRTALHSSRSEHKTLPGGARAALRSDRNAVDLHGMHLRAQRCRSAISVLRPLYRGAAEAARACTGSTRRGAGRCETAGLGEAARKPEPAAYLHLLRRLGIARKLGAAPVLFIDNSAENEPL